MRSVSLYAWCCCILATVIGQLKPVVENNNEHDYIIHIISMYNEFMEFKNFIIFNGDLDHVEGIVPSFHQHILETLGRPIIVAGPKTGSLQNLVSSHNAAVVLLTGIDDPVLNVLQNTFSELNLLPILFVYKSRYESPPTTENIEEFFKWCSKNKFHNSVLLLKRKNEYELWVLKMKSTSKITRITEWHINTLKKRKFEYLNQRNIKVAFYQSLPFVHVYNSSDQRDITGDNVSLGGYTGIMIGEFIRFGQGSMQIFEMQSKDYCNASTQGRIGNNNIEIGANLVPTTNLAIYSPLSITTKYCLVVSNKRVVPLGKYLSIVIGKWDFFAFFVFLYSMNIIFKRLGNPRMPVPQLLWESYMISSGFTVIIRVSNGMSRSEKIMMICSLFYTMLILCILAGIIATGITTGFKMPEIIDIESFEANEMDIMVSVSQAEEASQIGTISRVLMDRMIIVDQNVLDQHMNSLNDSFIYIIDTYKWIQFDFLQERLRQPKLKLAPESLCSVDHHLKLPVYQEIRFSLVMERFITQSHESGHTKKWTRQGLEQLKSANLIRQAPYEPHIQKPLPLEFFFISFQWYAMSLLVGLIVLVIECLLGYWKKLRNN